MFDPEYVPAISAECRNELGICQNFGYFEQVSKMRLNFLGMRPVKS
ncbi:MAG: hypothetical protein HOP01_05650 [Gallionella sp.]|nr:hypothetical protein [Gallionella sp.]